MSAPAHPFLPLLAETLAATGAREILRIGTMDWSETLIAGEQITLEEALASPAHQGRKELVVACLCSGGDSRQARQLIAAMRDLLARQLLVFVPENLLDDTTLTGLGLTRQARFELNDGHWQAWSYDIRSYKSVPDWLNPRFWANPDNWNKYRW
ncbi:MAG: DUF6231 family protein [Moraxellaceae bacterium]